MVNDFPFTSCKTHTPVSVHRTPPCTFFFFYCFRVGGVTDTSLIHTAVWSRIIFPAVYMPFTQVSTHRRSNAASLSAKPPPSTLTGNGVLECGKRLDLNSLTLASNKTDIPKIKKKEGKTYRQIEDDLKKKTQNVIDRRHRLHTETDRENQRWSFRHGSSLDF